MQSAFDAARYYLDAEDLSKSALLQRMASNGFETYSEAEALYAVDHVGADWKAEAVERVRHHELPLLPWRLMQDLTLGDGFTTAEARYAVSHAGLDWNAQAIAAAKFALDAEAIPKSQLVKELARWGFTDAQVRYAVEKVRGR